MKKIVFILTGFIAIANVQAQTSDSVIVTGEAYMKVEGRGKTPNNLEGNWVLTSGVAANNKEKSKAIYKSKPKPGTEVRRDSVTTSTTVNGVVETTTEVEYQRIKSPGKQITPAQKSNMHKPQGPSISFYGLNQTFSGFTGCNKIAGRYTIDGNKITINAYNPATKMECIGDYDEQDFLKKLSQVTKFKATNGRLELLANDDVLLVFAKK